MINMAFDLTAAISGLDKIATTANEAVRPAAQAGAQVFYNEVKINAKRGNETRYLKGGRTRPAGLLASAIYQVYSLDNSSEKSAEYHISWNKKKAPHGHLVEFGHNKIAKENGVNIIKKGKFGKRPFLRPAYDTVNKAAGAAVQDELEKRIKAAL